MQVIFSGRDNSYYSGYHYVAEEDNDALQSVGHPDLKGVVPQKRACSCLEEKETRSAKGKAIKHSGSAKRF